MAARVLINANGKVIARPVGFANCRFTRSPLAHFLPLIGLCCALQVVVAGLMSACRHVPGVPRLEKGTYLFYGAGACSQPAVDCAHSSPTMLNHLT